MRKKIRKEKRETGNRIWLIIMTLLILVSGGGFYVLNQNIYVLNQNINNLRIENHKQAAKIEELQRENVAQKLKIEELHLKIERMEKRIEKLEPPSPPSEIIGEVCSTELLSFLKRELRAGDQSFPLCVLDKKYELITVDEIKRFLRKDRTEAYFYRVHIFDCDDYAFRLQGQITIPEWSGVPLGIILGETPEGPHAWNIFVTREGGELVLYEIEPQTDEIRSFYPPVDNTNTSPV